jgi:hypothetical protein
MTTKNEKLQALEAEADKAWADYLKVKRPTHQVRNCPSDLDAETQALQVWQAKRQAVLDSVPLLRAAQGGGA